VKRRVLLIEDEPGLVLTLTDRLRSEGFEVAAATDGMSGRDRACGEPWDLILLDVMLPGMSGFDVCREIRQKGVLTPVIMLTARGQEIDKVLGLELGADDYITKPFSVRELLSRVKAVLRRSGSEKKTAGDLHQIGRLSVDLVRYSASDAKGPVDLSHKEFELLKFFIEHAGQIVHRDQLLDQVWGYDIYPNSRTVDNFIVRLRKKIEINPAQPKHLLTVHGFGYKLIP
jgi:DNA-binding response OmpR family regulator